MVDRSTRGHVCVIYTGGTIGMRVIDPDLHPEQATMLDPHEVEEALRSGCDMKMDVTFERLLDEQGDFAPPLISSEIARSEWRQIALTVKRHYDAYDGFVILHGTDTMAWTASALSFMFGNLSKPIVLTGSQRPIASAPSDAIGNFVSSVMIAGQMDDSIPLIPEVVICFGDVVLRGNRATKISAASLQGFGTPNAPGLGRVGRRFDFDAEQIRRAPTNGDAFFVRTELEPAVVDVLLYPGLPAPTLRALLETNVGAVLRTFGAGNAAGGEEVRKVLCDAARAGMVLVNVTQTDEGTVEAGMLTGSRVLTDCGVLSGLDLTPEAALTKLMVVLGSEAPAVAAEQMQLDQRGEQSMDLIELSSTSRGCDAEGISRLILSPALHARARPENLVSAVLRIAGPFQQDDPDEATIAVYLNHWHAGRRSETDVRYAGTGTLRRGNARHGGALVLDVTALGRQIFATGAPVTLTIVSSAPKFPVELRASLSLFTQRFIADLS